MSRLPFLAVAAAMLVAGCGGGSDRAAGPTAPAAVPSGATVQRASSEVPSSNTTSGSTVGPVGAGGPAPAGPPTPDLGTFGDGDALIAALRASGPLDNEEPAAQAAGRAPGLSICVPQTRDEPGVGTVVHQASAGYRDDGGVVLVLVARDGSREVRLYSTGDADPVTHGCRLLLRRSL